jgi:hypothetical protein
VPKGGPDDHGGSVYREPHAADPSITGTRFCPLCMSKRYKLP